MNILENEVDENKTYSDEAEQTHQSNNKPLDDRNKVIPTSTSVELAYKVE